MERRAIARRTWPMNRFPTKARWALGLCLCLVGLAGCKAGGWPSLDGLLGKTSDQVPGVMAPEERVAAIRKMTGEAVRQGPEAQESLAQKLAGLYPREPDALIRGELTRAARSLRGPTADSLLREATKDVDPDVRIDACEALRTRGGLEAAAALAEVLGSDTDPDVRLAAARALGETRDAAAVPALGAALEDRDPAMQHRAVSSLRQVAPQDLGNDAERWRHYVRGQPVPPPKPVSVVDRMQRLFY